MAIGTSNGETYPSHLEQVLDTLDKTQVAQTDIRTLFPHMPEEERKAWEQSPPRDLQFEYKGKSNILDIPKTLDSKGHEDGLFVDQLHPDILKLNQDEYDIRYVPNHEIFHIRKKLKPPLVGEADLPENARPTAADYTPDSTWAAMVDSFTNPDSKVPTAEKMVQGNYSKIVDWLTEHGKTPGQEMQNWSTKEKLGYMLSTAMGLVAPGKGSPTKIPMNARPKIDMQLSGKDLGVSNAEPRSFNPANSNIPGLGKAHSAMDLVERMSVDEFKTYMDTREADFVRNGGPPKLSAYERAVENQKAGRMNPTGDTADDFIKSLRAGGRPDLSVLEGGRSTKDSYWTMHSEKVHNLNNKEGLEIGSAVYREHNNTWVGSRFNPETNQIIDRKSFSTLEGASAYAEGRLEGPENPSQQPQGRPVPSLQQRQTQEAQRAANDRNYALGKGTERVNVGQGKGVLNDNKEEVMALIRKGSKPSEIARKYDITSAAVQQWIKRNGKINDISDILKD